MSGRRTALALSALALLSQCALPPCLHKQVRLEPSRIATPSTPTPDSFAESFRGKPEYGVQVSANGVDIHDNTLDGRQGNSMSVHFRPDGVEVSLFLYGECDTSTGMLRGRARRLIDGLPIAPAEKKRLKGELQATVVRDWLF